MVKKIKKSLIWALFLLILCIFVNAEITPRQMEQINQQQTSQIIKELDQRDININRSINQKYDEFLNKYKEFNTTLMVKFSFIMVGFLILFSLFIFSMQYFLKKVVYKHD